MPVARRPSGATTLALGLALAACSGDATGPVASVDVTVQILSLSGPTFSIGPDSGPRIACAVDVRASATGSGTATWLSATLRFYAGKDRSHPVDSTVVPAATVRAGWGSAGIRVGQSQESGVQVNASVPFGAEIVFHYQDPGSGVKATSVSFTCGPAPPTNASPPVITALTVEAPAAPLQPGDTLKVDYSVTSNAGLWKTVLALSGPCAAQLKFAEQFAPSVTRVVSLPIPSTCVLGVPLTINVTALDDAVQQISRSVAPGIALVDRTPPQVAAMLFPLLGGSATEHLAGEYFVGDSLYFIYIASDNYDLRTLVWEVSPAGFRDSLRVSGRSASPWLKVPIRPAWTGPIQLRLYARDSVGLTSDTLASPLDSIRVYPTVTRPSASTTVDGEIRDVAIDQRRGVIYLMQGNQWRIAVMSASTLTIAATVPLPAQGTDLDLTSGGDSLLVALPYERALGVIDLRQTPLAVTLLPITGLDTTIDQRPWSVKTAANGKAFVLLQGSAPSAYRLMEVDLGTGVQRLRTDAGDSGNVGGAAIQRSADHSTLILSSGVTLFQRYDAATDAFGPRHSTSRIAGLTVDPTGQHVALGLDVYDATLQFLLTVHSQYAGEIIPTAFSGDGLVLYQAIPYQWIVRSRLSDGAILDHSPSPIFPALIRMSPDGTMLIIVDNNCCATNRIATMDMR
jgi:hypothetical protein